ncbi:hypothetical protein [uncultured Lacinutrix sp.]|uniref:hypothetical protein n=1 Tax=uncultured Lacinutrix sp. TaxID=574032 RepID=UPI002625A799|nr:hypothetical protein [uncultured Lacinutrix sp.]
MKNILKEYVINGTYTFELGDKLSVATKGVKNEPGVYLFYTIKNQIEELVYIGSSGTMQQNGIFKDQLLKKRLQNKQEGVRRQVFFEMKIKQDNIDAIKVEWYVTFNENIKHLPAYIEAKLLQAYYDDNKQLPIWNKKA